MLHIQFRPKLFRPGYTSPSHSAYSQPSFLFYGDSVIKSCEGNQQGDLESPALFSDSIQDLIDSLESKTNLWYLDVGNSSDDYRTVLKDLKKIVYHSWFTARPEITSRLVGKEN